MKGTFAAQVRELEKRLDNFSEGQARKLSEMTRDATKRHTPVGERRDPRTGVSLGPSGELRDSVTAIVVRREGTNTWVGGAESLLSYASDVEWDTRRHIIEAKTGHVLHFWSGQSEVYARKVSHPGTRGKFMFRQGLDDAVREWERNDSDLKVLVKEVFDG